ncbi:MAG TPA: bifunctional 2-keto-4-hydroxyglutarate aldolase/2-keto-3-deoxy-6-phosphogluconate aldolase [Candidatus Sulfotelmatobacter sp.]|nr:bifunctional 2-keto-4-hydroxyglutarate aldolase/2-keto-3-deoxy-6-phosphogluconate aldolase [Candidatus Sulfotelmatobacter sp.]
MSMSKVEVLHKIVASGLVAVIRAENPEQAAHIADACALGGITALEITFTVPGAAGVIEHLAKKCSHEILLGAGTVLDPETARIAILAGAQFVVSPALNPETARLCNRYQTPYMPGAATIGEVIAAMECGADIVKVFPGEILGPAFVKAVKGPLPQAQLMPTGGVNLENVAQWINAGAVAIGVGGNLTAGAKSGEFASVTHIARQFVEKIKEARAR